MLRAPTNQIVNLGQSAHFEALATGPAPLLYQWSFGNSPIPGATNTVLVIRDATEANEGVYSVMVSSGTNAISASATLTVRTPPGPARRISIPPIASIQEGAHVSFPVIVQSSGDIGALTFEIDYDANYLTNPELIFSEDYLGAFKQVNADVSGQIRATFALPGQTLTAGTNVLARVNFFSRSVPETLTTRLGLEVLGVYNANGDPIPTGTAVNSSEVTIRLRHYIGDNNANDVLDVGDASTIMRLVSLLDPVRPWDVTSNDLNANSDLDAGDIIRVLRAVVRLDPQPGSSSNVVIVPVPPIFPPYDGRYHAFGAASGGETVLPQPLPPVTPNDVSLTAGQRRVEAGDKVTFKFNLSNPKGIAGVSFNLNYPANVLRLENSSSLQIGEAAPASAVSLWNVSPAKDDYSAQDGTVYGAITSPSEWAGTNGEVAEFTFTVQPGVSDRYFWPVTVSATEVSDGHDVRALGTAASGVTGREAVPAKLGALGQNPDGGFTLAVQGEIGVRYQIEVSDDLKTWNPLDIQVNETGSLIVADPDMGRNQHRYYRVTQLD
jgi:hypothetical protein